MFKPNLFERIKFELKPEILSKARFFEHVSVNDIDLFVVWTKRSLLNCFDFLYSIKLIDVLGEIRDEENNVNLIFFPHNYLKVPFKYLIGNSDKTNILIHCLFYEHPLFCKCWEKKHVGKSLLNKVRLDVNQLSNKEDNLILSNINLENAVHLSRYLLNGYIALGCHREENNFIRDYAIFNIKYAFKCLNKIYNYCEKEKERTEIQNIIIQDIQETHLLKEVLEEENDKKNISCQTLRNNYPEIIATFAQIITKEISKG